MKASRTPARPATTAAGSSEPSSASGAGCSHGTDGSRGRHGDPVVVGGRARARRAAAGGSALQRGQAGQVAIR